MLPTRELAKQVADDFLSLNQARSPNSFSTTTIYGGVPYRDQEYVLRDGVDILVGTPGRVIDFLTRGNLKLDNIGKNKQTNEINQSIQQTNKRMITDDTN